MNKMLLVVLALFMFLTPFVYIEVKSGELNLIETVYAEENDVGDGCPLGPKVTKDLYGILKIFKIAAPLIIVALTIWEVVNSLLKGDVTSEFKTLYKKFLKRLMYAVILFFLPILVDQVMQMANVWDANGMCSFAEVESEE